MSINSYKNSLLINYFQNKTMQRLILAKTNILTIIIFILKRTIKLVPVLTLIYTVFLIFVLKFDTINIFLFTLLILYLFVIRIIKNYLKFLTLILVFLINILNFKQLFYLQQLLSFISISIIYIICYKNKKRVNYFKINLNHYIIKVLLCVIISYIIEYLCLKFFNKNYIITFYSIVIFGSGIIFDYDCEIAAKLEHKNFFNMYKLAYTYNKKKILYKWDKIKIQQLILIVILSLNFSNFMFFDFDLTYFITKIYLSLQILIIYYFNLDLFIRNYLLNKSVVLKNNFILYLIKGWLYLPIFVISFLYYLFKNFLIFWFILFIISVFVFLLVLFFYQKNWKQNEN